MRARVLSVASLSRMCSEMSLERFGFSSARSAATPIPASTSATTVVTESSTSAVHTPVSQSSSSTAPPTKRRRFSSNWSEGREWLKYDERESGAVMFCEWCRRFKKSDLRNQFVSGCSSMKLENVKKHEQSQSHKDAAGAFYAQVGPSPMEVALQSMEREELVQMKMLFNTAFYLVSAERPFRDFPALLDLQRKNSIPLGKSYNNPKQAKTFVHFIAEEIRNDLVLLVQGADFFSVCMDSSTDKATIDEEMVQVRLLKNNSPVYRFVAVKPLARADAASTVEAIVSALEIDCQCSEWKSKLVGVCADGAAVNMGVRSGAAKQLQDIVPHLVPVHCCAHRVELALNTISTQIDYFKTLEDTLLELYKLYHKSPLCWSGLQEVGQVLQVKILKPTKLAGTRWVEHRHRALKILLDG